MSVKRLALSFALIAALAEPLLFSQEASAGNPDDIASVFPEETILFAEVTRPGKLSKDSNEYLAAFCKPEGRKNVLEQLEKLGKEKALNEVPEKLQKDLEKGMPSVQRIAVALGRSRGEAEPFWAIVAVSANEDFFKTVIDDLAVFAREEVKHGGTKILVIRKIGKHDLNANFCIAASGKRLVVSSTTASVAAVLDRAAGKAAGGDLRKNASYARFSPQTGEDPSFRAFGVMDWHSMGGIFGGGFGARRMSAHGMDVADAVFGFRRIRGATLEASLKPGKIAATTRLLIDSPCAFYDVWRQPAGPKEALKLVPGDAQVVAHVNLRGGKDLLAEIDKMVKRYAEIEGSSRPKGNPGFERPEFDWKKEFEREMGLPIDDVAAAIGTEAAFAMVGDDAFGGEQNMVGSLLFVVALADAEKAKAVIDKLTPKIGPYETKKEGEVTYWVPQREVSQPVFAVHGKTALIGSKIETLKKALKAGAEGTGFAKQLPASAAGASKLVSIRNNALWSAAKMGLGAELPDLAKDLDLDALSTIVFTEEKNELRISSQDAGLGTVVQTGVMMVPFAFVMATSMRMSAFGGLEEPVDPAAPAPKEAPALPADKLAAEVKKHISGMRADDVVTRDDAEATLKALGPQAAKLLAEAVRKESDAEVKGRILGILGAWKAYDAFPEILKTKVDGFLAGFQKATGEDNGGRFIQWRQDGMSEFPYSMEPMWADTSLARRVEHHDILDAPQGVRALAERLTSDRLNPQQQRNLAAVFAYNDCAGAGDLILAAKQKVQDAEARCFLHVALGWSKDPKAVESLHAGLKDTDVWMRRASFMGIDRSKDTGVIPKLMDLLADKDHETRWNAAFTLRELTGGRVAVNVYVPEGELKAAVEAGRAWWEKSKATFKIGE